jgi:hypothetical protein
MIERIIIALLTQLGSAALAWALQRKSKSEKKALDEAAADEKLAVVKKAVSEAMDGTPITPEQRKKINAAMADFVRSAGDGGL